MASVDAQSVPVQHVIVEDLEGIGIDGMYAAIPEHVDELAGEYVMILGDDDLLADRWVAEELEAQVFARRPPVVMVKADHMGRLLPDPWRGEPVCGSVGASCFVVRRDLWASHANDWGKRYEGDFDFIHALWEAYAEEFVWWDRVAVLVPQIGGGRPE